MTIKNYKDLEVWTLGRGLVKSIYEVTTQLPTNEQYGLTSQIRRAAVSIPSNIAEGHSRAGTKDFIQFISIAIGSAAEVETQLLLIVDLGYLKEENLKAIFLNIMILQKKLHSLRTSLKSRLTT